MMPRAVVFDVYKTLLEVGPAPADRETRWQSLWRSTFGGKPRVDLVEFIAAADAEIGRDHAVAKTQGILRPEIYWPEILARVAPELQQLSAVERDAFMDAQIALTHTVRLMPGAAEVLTALLEKGVVLGIASNAQPYTLRELAEALAPRSLGLAQFAPDLRFWSFEQGFSKPDPHVFRLLGARLRARGIDPAEALMVGDRADNDMAPAAGQGWKTWQLTSSTPAAGPGGGWPEFKAYLKL